MALGFSPYRRALHCAFLSRPSRVEASPTDGTRLLRVEAQHSGFFDTTLGTLLEALRIRRVILTSMAGNICVLFTANDAYMRDYKIFAPADCIVSNTAADNDHALYQLKTVLKGNVAVSTRLTFQANGRPRHARRP
jgi:nicotinamidase-related amidase